MILKKYKQLSMSHIDAILQRYPNSDREFLLPILQDIQKDAGFLSREAVIKVGEYLKIPTSKIFAVATFYDQFRFTPRARYRIRLCNGTACHMDGAGGVREAFEQRLGIRAGEITGDKMFSLELTSCMGACGMSPVVKINDDFYAAVEPSFIDELIQGIKAGEQV